MTRPIYEIATEIRETWPNVNYAAQPYLDAMAGCEKITDSYGYDSVKSIITYFLSNAGSWRGDDARRIKTELKQMISGK